MTFRTRIFLLVVLVAVTAIGATAWLTLSLASREVSRTQSSAERHSAEIRTALTRYGLLHGRWVGVADLVGRLSEDTGVRIRLQTLSGEVLVDSDHLAGRAAGPVAPDPVEIDARPQPMWVGVAPPQETSAGPGASGPSTGAPSGTSSARPPQAAVAPADAQRARVRAQAEITAVMQQLADYRTALRIVRCLNRVDPTVPAVLPVDRQPYLTADLRTTDPACAEEAVARAQELGEELEDRLAFARCTERISPSPGYDFCLRSTFAQQLGGSGAEPLELYFGLTDTDPLALIGRPALIGVTALAAIVIIGTALVARQVSRPVRRLTMASRLLAGGDLEARVPTTGRGELAQLSHSFNTMAEAVQRSEARQRRLVADVAHELRTPLSNLRGYLEGLQDGVVEPSRELFASLHEETLLQGRILDDLQVLALAEVGSLAYTRVTVDLAEVAEAAVTAHRAVAAEAGLGLTLDAPLPVWIQADPDRLRQVLGNLLTNAIRYTDAGGEIVVRVVAADGGAELSVRDTGSGIAADDLPHVFDRFWRADPARQRATGGSGLGLTIAQRIVADHGGLIEASSILGVGTTFTVQLPPAAVLPPEIRR